MEKICKICLAKGVKLHSIVNSHLQVLYDILIENPIIADQRKILLCQKCCSGLQDCYELRMTCLSSEKLYSQTTNSFINCNRNTRKNPQLPPKEPHSEPPLEVTPIVEPLIEIHVKEEREEYEPIAELCEVEMKENVTESDPSTTAATSTKPETANEKIYPDEEINYIIDETKLVSDKEMLNIKNDDTPCPCNRDKCFKCDICQKCYSQRQKLTIHTRIHTGEKPYKCEVCQKGFHTATVLTVHQRVHTGEKPFQCYVCEKSFKTKSARDMHINVIHANQKPFKCDFCDKSFSMQAKLNYHRSVHTGDRQFKCSQCDQSFIKKYKLDSHVRTWHS